MKHLLLIFGLFAVFLVALAGCNKLLSETEVIEKITTDYQELTDYSNCTVKQNAIGSGRLNGGPIPRMEYDSAYQCINSVGWEGNRIFFKHLRNMNVVLFVRGKGDCATACRDEERNLFVYDDSGEIYELNNSVTN